VKKHNLRTNIPNFRDTLAIVRSLPIVIKTTEIHQTNTINDLKNKLSITTNQLRSRNITSSIIVAFGVDAAGNVGITANNDHSYWDGMQSGNMVNRMLARTITSLGESDAN